MQASPARSVQRLAGGLAAVAIVTLAFFRWQQVANPVTVSTCYLLIVFLVAATSQLWAAVIVSLSAVLAFNVFFLPPIGSVTIADPHNWVALISFMTVSLVASNLASRVRAREREAVARRDELSRLFDLSRDVLLLTDSRESVTLLTRSIARRFDLPFAAVALPHETEWEIYRGGTTALNLDPHQLWAAFSAASRTLEFDARERTYSGHATVNSDGHTVRLVPLRSGTTPVGLLAASGRPVEPGTLDTLAGITAMAIERVRLLEERKSAELARQSEDLKAALLASIGHDLRTPLTAIQIAASNIRGASLTDSERSEQAMLIEAEVERLSRLFQDILEMARIDAGAVSAEARWVHPSEIIEAARSVVGESVRGHQLLARNVSDDAIELDPRLTASALAHVLENAAQYTPAGASIEVSAAIDAEGLLLQVRDRGPGIADADLPHLFERFYRGRSGHARDSGTGLGLWIARQLLAVQGGRIWVENLADGGARFTLRVPGPSRPAPTHVTEMA